MRCSLPIPRHAFRFSHVRLELGILHVIRCIRTRGRSPLGNIHRVIVTALHQMRPCSRSHSAMVGASKISWLLEKRDGARLVLGSNSALLRPVFSPASISSAPLYKSSLVFHLRPDGCRWL